MKAVALLALIATSAHAAECREDVEARLEAIAAAVDEEVKGLSIWSYSWGSIYAAAAVTQGVLGAVAKPGSADRIDFLFGGAAALVGSASLYLLPLRFTLPLKRLRSHWDEPDRCKLLAEAEETLAHVESEQKTARSWIAHAGNVLFNAALSLTLGLAWGHWKAGLISGVVGIAVGELNLFTQPSNLWRAHETPAATVVPIVTKDFTGVGWVMAF